MTTDPCEAYLVSITADMAGNLGVMGSGHRTRSRRTARVAMLENDGSRTGAATYKAAYNRPTKGSKKCAEHSRDLDMKLTLSISLALALLASANSVAAICCVSSGPGGCADVPNLSDRSLRGFINRRTGELTSREAEGCCCVAGTAALCLTQCR